MSDIHDLSQVRAALEEIREENEDVFYDLPYSFVGLFVDPDDAGVPEGWEIFVHEVHAERTYDSYGYASTEDGFVVLRIEKYGDKALYRLPTSYASFEGWNIDISGLTKTEKKEKVITTWEWTRG